MLHLHTLWFIILAVLWVGFFVLEGFDFGVGMLHMLVGRDEPERELAISTIGPWWDGNEVWLIVAGAGTFAAFPSWYATMFSAFYLPLLIVLVALMARGVGLEFTTKRSDPSWRSRWRWAVAIGSLLTPLLLGVALGDLLHGLPIDSNHEYTGGFLDLLTGYGIWTGLTLLGLCLLHGATFLKLRTTGPLRERAAALGRPIGWAAVALVVGFIVWTRTVGGPDVPDPVQILALLAVLAAVSLMSTDHDGFAFAASGVAIAACVGSIFIDLYPNVMVSSTSDAYNLTVSNAASGGYALKVMTIVTVAIFPVVLLYQGWSFYVFRARIRGPAPRARRPKPARARSPTASRADGRRAAPRRDRRRRVRRAVRCEVPAAGAGGRDADRPHQPPHLPAAALPARHRHPLRGGRRAAPARGAAQASQRDRRARRRAGLRPRCAHGDGRPPARRRRVEVPYDSLIVAAGATGSYFGHDEFCQFAPGMKTVDDALELRARIFGAFEMAELEEDPEQRRAWLTFAVIGAGPTGVEMAGQIAELSRRALKDNFRRIDPADARVLLLDGGEEPLATFGDRLCAIATKEIERTGVELRMRTRVTDVGPEGITLQGPEGEERIACRAKVWAAGVQASPLAAALAAASGAKTDRAGHVEVLADCTLPGHPEVFVVGDMMALDHLPGVAEVAMQSGIHAARTIKRRLHGELDAKPFVYRDLGSMATISRFRAIVSFKGIKVGGFLGWLMWAFVHITFLTGFKNRWIALFKWLSSFVGSSRDERTITIQQASARVIAMRIGVNPGQEDLSPYLRPPGPGAPSRGG